MHSQGNVLWGDQNMMHVWRGKLYSSCFSDSKSDIHMSLTECNCAEMQCEPGSSFCMNYVTLHFFVADSTVVTCQSKECLLFELQISLANWNQDEATGGFGGSHCMVKGGYSSLMEPLAASLNIQLDIVVSQVAYNSDGVTVTSASGEQCLQTA